MARVFKDLGRVIGVSEHGEPLLLVKSYALVDGKWRMTSWYVDAVEDRPAVRGAVRAVLSGTATSAGYTGTGTAPLTRRWDYGAPQTGSVVGSMARQIDAPAFFKWFWTGLSPENVAV
eukprot:Selendium_serpulae@DN3244_c0_g1_i1.p2